MVIATRAKALVAVIQGRAAERIDGIGGVSTQWVDDLVQVSFPGRLSLECG
jgi:hypothetical protein